MIRRALPLIAFATIGCHPMAPPAGQNPAPPPAEGKCEAGQVQRFVGKMATKEIVSQIVAQSGSRIARVIRPGQMVTMDYREDRVDIRIDAKTRILNISCG